MWRMRVWGSYTWSILDPDPSGGETFKLACLSLDDGSLLGWQDRLSHLSLLHKFLVEVGEVVADGWLVWGSQLLLDKFI